MADSNARPLAAEFLGTFFLLATIAGSGIMGERLANGQTAAALLPHALAIGAILVVFIMLFGRMSGAHFNPAVTAAFWLDGGIASRLAVAYVPVQIAGGVAGVLAAHIMFDLALGQIGTEPRASTGLWAAEFVATFGLVFGILGGVREKPEAVPWIVGLYIGAAIWFTASTSFANPAVTLARALTNTFTGIRPLDVPAFLLAQIAGAGLAVPVVRFLWPSDGRG